MTPKSWTRGAIRSHVGAAHQRLFRIRGNLVEHASKEGSNIGPDVEELAGFLRDEFEWLTSMQPIPDRMRKSERASFLRSYGEAIEKTARSLNRAVETNIAGKAVEPQAWEPLGVAMLEVLAHGNAVRRMS